MPSEGLTPVEIHKIVHSYIGVSSGYLGDFTYRSHADFYLGYCDLDIDPYLYQGTTRERFIDIISSREPIDQARIVRGVTERFPVDGPDAPDRRTEELRIELLQWANRLEGVDGVVVEGVVPRTPRADVKQAIADMETLLRSQQGASGAVDRIHTALHAYLIGECESAQINYDKEASISKLLKELRTHHPRLAASPGSTRTLAYQIVQSFGQALDAINQIRNNSSMAHPNDGLLQEPEANLVINAGRTILAYLDSRLNNY